MDARRLYIDATVAVSNDMTATVVFGPFTDQSEVERALTAFVARENAMGAVIRDPNAGVSREYEELLTVLAAELDELRPEVEAYGPATELPHELATQVFHRLRNLKHLNKRLIEHDSPETRAQHYELRARTAGSASATASSIGSHRYTERIARLRRSASTENGCKSHSMIYAGTTYAINYQRGKGDI